MIHSFLHFIFNINIVIIDIFQLICLINILTYDFSRFEMMEFLYQNWSQNLIKTIKIEYQTGSDSDFNDNIEPLINISFPGTIAGCDCSLYNNEIYLGKYSNKLIEKNCGDIKPVNSFLLNTLYLPEINDFSDKGIIISIERYNNLSYLDLLNNTQNKIDDYFISDEQGCNCEKYSKICIDCGIIDSLGNHLCITSSKGINNNCFKIKLEYDYSLKDIALIKNFEFIFNSNNNNSLQYPIEFITTFKNNQICIMQDETISSPLINYNLIYWNNLTSIVNSHLKNRIKYLPLFPYDEFININFSLAYRNYIGFNIKCINSTKFIGDNFASYEKLLKLKFILYLFFAMIFFPCFLIFLMMVSQTDILTFFQRIVICGSFTINISIFIECLIFEYMDMKEKKEEIKKIADNFCGDYLTINLFFCILEDFTKLEKYILYCYYFTVLMLVMSIGKIVLVITKHLKKRIMFNLNF